jgi:predicted permease
VARRSLVVVQVGLSVLLLIGAGLFVRTLWNLQGSELGFEPDRILLFDIDPPRTRYAGDRRSAVFARIEREIARLPGVQAASLSSEALVANNRSTTRITPAGRAARPGDADRAWINEVGDRFFETMGIPILYGRPLGPQDRAGTLPVAVVNQQFVRTFFPGDTPIGKTFTRGQTVYHIVGISGDARFGAVNEPVPPTFYPHFAQAADLNAMTFEVRAAIDEAALRNTIRETVQSIDKDLPVLAMRSQVEQIDATFSRERMFAALSSGFGLLALVLACVGIYGIMASSVASRIGEIGIRMALGAERRRILVMILRETIGLTGVGVGLGVLAAAGLARYVESFLYGLTPFDPMSASGAVLLMLIVALLAAWWPARLASRLDPMQALRHD